MLKSINIKDENHTAIQLNITKDNSKNKSVCKRIKMDSFKCSDCKKIINEEDYRNHASFERACEYHGKEHLILHGGNVCKKSI